MKKKRNLSLPGQSLSILFRNFFTNAKIYSCKYFSFATNNYLSKIIIFKYYLCEKAKNVLDRSIYIDDMPNNLRVFLYSKRLNIIGLRTAQTRIVFYHTHLLINECKTGDYKLQLLQVSFLVWYFNVFNIFIRLFWGRVQA